MKQDHAAADRYITTDLAVERRSAAGGGADYRQEEDGGVRITRLRITDAEGERAIGRPIGNYVTVETGRPWLMGNAERDRVCRVLTREIRRMAERICDCKSVLVCGLGNRSVTVDSLGPAVADSLVITRHVRLCEKRLFDSLFSLEVASFAPGVLAQTGIDTEELVRGAVGHVGPDLVVAVDALAARSADRLMTTVQLCDTGIAPGSGMGNRRCALDQSTLGVPVIAVGVPTVVNSSTLIRDALEIGGVGDISPELERLLDNGRSFFVSPKESDLAVRELSSVIARALNRAFGSDGLE